MRPFEIRDLKLTDVARNMPCYWDPHGTYGSAPGIFLSSQSQDLSSSREILAVAHTVEGRKKDIASGAETADCLLIAVKGSHRRF